MKKFIIFLFLWAFAYINANAVENKNLGEKIYFQTCVSCHGQNGLSKTDMKLAVKPRLLAKSILTKEQIKLIVSNGTHTYGSFADIMPSFKYVYNNDELDAVTNFVYNKFFDHRKEHKTKLLKESNPEKIVFKTGKKLFKRNCSLCHGKNGDGNSPYIEMSKKNNTFIYPYNLKKILLDQEQIFLFIKHGGKYWGTHGDIMPAWKVKYNDSQLMSIAKYINDVVKNKKK